MCISLIGCSGSEQSEKDEMPPPPPVTQEPVKKQAEPSPVVKQVDTLKVEVKDIDKPKFEPAPINPENKFERGNYSIQLGAYKMPDNADRIAAITKERFNMNVYTSFDTTDELYKVYLGDFETKDAARTFRDVISFKYPEDYKGAWVFEKPNK
ncbi:MAG: SPOR domain-containing protein [Ignavibacteriales bacterium]|nr:SPOR domain-containing protein [Ignavibacteriales bacterium]